MVKLECDRRSRIAGWSSGFGLAVSRSDRCSGPGRREPRGSRDRAYPCSGAGHCVRRAGRGARPRVQRLRAGTLALIGLDRRAWSLGRRRGRRGPESRPDRCRRRGRRRRPYLTHAPQCCRSSICGAPAVPLRRLRNDRIRDSRLRARVLTSGPPLLLPADRHCVGDVALLGMTLPGGMKLHGQAAPGRKRDQGGRGQVGWLAPRAALRRRRAASLQPPSAVGPA